MQAILLQEALLGTSDIENSRVSEIKKAAIEKLIDETPAVERYGLDGLLKIKKGDIVFCNLRNKMIHL